MKRLIKLTMLVALMSGCIHRIPHKVRKEPIAIGDPVIRDGYAYRQEIGTLENDVFLVWASSQIKFRTALVEIRCGKCTYEPYGYVFIVRRTRQ